MAGDNRLTGLDVVNDAIAFRYIRSLAQTHIAIEINFVLGPLINAGVAGSNLSFRDKRDGSERFHAPHAVRRSHRSGSARRVEKNDKRGGFQRSIAAYGDDIAAIDELLLLIKIV